MSNPNSYGESEPRLNEQSGDWSRWAQQPAPGQSTQYSQQGDFGGQVHQSAQPGVPVQAGAQKAKLSLNSLSWNQLGACIAGIAALLILLFSFFKWVGYTWSFSLKSSGSVLGSKDFKLGLNGWGALLLSDGPDTSDFPGYSQLFVGIALMIATLAMLIGAAVMLWKRIQPRVAVGLAIGAGVLQLVLVSWLSIAFGGMVEESVKLARRAQNAGVFDEDSGSTPDFSSQGGLQVWGYLVVVVALALIVLGAVALVKYRHLLDGEDEESEPQNKFGLPIQQGQEDQSSASNPNGQQAQFGQQPGHSAQ
ncbi:hypothetical protein [Corynebacterium jeikeium]|uniref:hypothetical protein n=1 Tax=Corynebacterium jeikeium TaxID=38289 RepID=UPI0011C041C3|nr:hypothetical protein [Corynebacterium jeikeium]